VFCVWKPILVRITDHSAYAISVGLICWFSFLRWYPSILTSAGSPLWLMSVPLGIVMKWAIVLPNQEPSESEYADWTNAFAKCLATNDYCSAIILQSTRRMLCLRSYHLLVPVIWSVTYDLLPLSPVSPARSLCGQIEPVSSHIAQFQTWVQQTARIYRANQHKQSTRWRWGVVRCHLICCMGKFSRQTNMANAPLTFLAGINELLALQC